MLIKDFGEYALYRFLSGMTQNICEFIVRVNYDIHKQSVTENVIKHDIQKSFKKEMSLFSEAYYYVIMNKKGEIVGSIRAGLWNKREKLPIYEEFDISPAYVNHSGNVWYIGRFAIDASKIDENLRKHRLMIFKLLLFHAIQHVCAEEDNIMLAECDRKLHEKVKLLKICSTEIGESKQYIGSETVPIYNTSNGLKLFLWNHKHLQCLPVTESISTGNSKKESEKPECYSQEQDLAV